MITDFALGAIGTLSAQDILTQCYLGKTQLCSGVTRPNGVLTVAVANYNIAQSYYRGIDFEAGAKTSRVTIRARVETRGRTGVEMEALTAVAAGLLTIYDMCKAVDRGMVLSDIGLHEKSGGKSGTWKRSGDKKQR
mgnify:CR=1 FL=1